MLEDGRRAVDRRLGDGRLDELPLGYRVCKELRTRKGLPVREPVLRQGAEDAAVVVEDAAVPVAEGAALE